MELTFTSKLAVSDEVILKLACDLITTAVEGGINYWASVSDYRWGDPDLYPGTETFARVTIWDNEDDVRYDVTQDGMVQTVKNFLSGPVEFYNDGYSDTFKVRLITALREIASTGCSLYEADFDYDAGDADCMVQLACFGKIVYG